MKHIAQTLAVNMKGSWGNKRERGDPVANRVRKLDFFSGAEKAETPKGNLT